MTPPASAPLSKEQLEERDRGDELSAVWTPVEIGDPNHIGTSEPVEAFKDRGLKGWEIHANAPRWAGLGSTLAVCGQEHIARRICEDHAELLALRALIRHLPHCDQVHNMGCSTLDELFKRAAALREGGT